MNFDVLARRRDLQHPIVILYPAKYYSYHPQRVWSVSEGSGSYSRFDEIGAVPCLVENKHQPIDAPGRSVYRLRLHHRPFTLVFSAVL